jgi:PKD repeat protein
MQSTIAGICRAAALVAIAAGVAACGVDSQAAPSLIGPSGFAQSVTLTASPDRLPRDGSSQSVITVTVRNESGQAVSGQRVTLGATAGTLSQSDVVTGSDGRATFALTAPPAGTTGNTIDVFATPAGGNFADVTTRTLTIAVTGISNATVPAPSFTVTPAVPEVRQVVTFDASATTDEGTPCGTACSYAWNFDDGSTASGMIVTHTFISARPYNVTLTVTDAAGASATLQRMVTVATVAAPTVALTVSPDPPFVNHQALFTASATPATGHSIQRYEWNFGDGTTETTATGAVLKTYSQVGTYVVTVAAFDDLDQRGIVARSVSVTHSVAPPAASFTVAPSSPAVRVPVTFRSTSTVGIGATIERYVWDFGDGSSPLDTGTVPATVKTYESPGTFIVTLTITDSLGRQNIAVQTVTVVPVVP